MNLVSTRAYLIQSLSLFALAACGSAPPATAEANSGAGQAQSAQPFTTAPVASFTTPWAMDFLPGSGLPMTNMALVSEKDGRLWLVDVATGRKQAVGGVPQAKVAGQGGLGDVVAHPDFAGNQRVYLSFVEAGPDGASGAAVGYGRLLFTGPAVPGGPVAASIDGFKIIWRQTPKVSGNGHFAHRIAFAPDGTLFLSSGDRQKMDPAQDMSSDLGKVIHLTAEGQPASGNPWASRGGRAASYWSIGHRNILGLAFAPDGRLWASEMGPKGGDELNLVVRGRNYGWPRASYGSHYDGEGIPDDHRASGFEEPKLWWNPVIAPAGLIIYSGDLFPQWKGDALIAALAGEALVRADIDGERATKAEQWPLNKRIRDIAQGPRGEVYLLEDEGRLIRLEPAR